LEQATNERTLFLFCFGFPPFEIQSRKKVPEVPARGVRGELFISFRAKKESAEQTNDFAEFRNLPHGSRLYAAEEAAMQRFDGFKGTLERQPKGSGSGNLRNP
jgi:hypothetical protein